MYAAIVLLVVAQPPGVRECYEPNRHEREGRPLLSIRIEVGRDRRRCQPAPAPSYQFAAPPQQRYCAPAPQYAPQRDRLRFEQCGPNGRVQFQRCAPSTYSMPGAYRTPYGCPNGGCPTGRCP